MRMGLMHRTRGRFGCPGGHREASGERVGACPVLCLPVARVPRAAEPSSPAFPAGALPLLPVPTAVTDTTGLYHAMERTGQGWPRPTLTPAWDQP